MCSAPVEIDAINRDYGIDFNSYFAHELTLLKQYEEAGLITINPAAIRVTAKGRLLALVSRRRVFKSGITPEIIF